MADEDILEWPVRTAEDMHFDVTTRVDPLADDVFVALPAHRTDPTDADYMALPPAEWLAGQTWTVNNPTVTCSVFVAKDTLERTKRYDAWVQIHHDPNQVIEIRAGADERGQGGTVVKGI